MAITKSAKKAHRASLRKRVFNVRRKRVLLSTTKDLRKVAVSGANSVEALAKAYKAIDKAAKKGVIKKNTAARRKSRLAKAVARGSAK
mgnify:CR=1 FL=1